MSVLLTIAAAILAGVLLLLALFLFLEVTASLGALKANRSDHQAGQCALVVPAHNEASVIAASLENYKEQMRSQDRLIVVADNCDDDTAEIARANGAEVLIRQDKERRGKGYALQFALDALRDNPPELVIFVDADCRFLSGALQRITSLASQKQRPVQALYLMKAPSGAGPRLKVAEFAWTFINQARMRGLQRMFDVTRFTGAGLAVPWEQIEKIPLASGEIVEDLSLTFELTAAGAPPMLDPDAVIESEFPTGEQALARQASRWSHGSVKYAQRAAPGWFLKGALSGNLRLLAAAIDLFIPPLIIFIALLGAAVIASAITWGIVGHVGPLYLSLWALFLTLVAIVLGWNQYGRAALPPSALIGVLGFIAGKAKVFGRSGRESAKTWTPTRSADDESPKS